MSQEIIHITENIVKVIQDEDSVKILHVAEQGVPGQPGTNGAPGVNGAQGPAGAAGAQGPAGQGVSNQFLNLLAATSSPVLLSPESERVLVEGTLAAGVITDIYTVPAGKVFIGQIINVRNQTGTASSVIHYHKIGGAHLLLRATGVNVTSPNMLGFIDFQRIFSAGDSVAIMASTVAGLKYRLSGILFPDNIGLKQSPAIPVDATRKVIYEVPVGKIAINPSSSASPFQNAAWSVGLVNSTGAAITGSWYFAEAGEDILTVPALYSAVVNSLATLSRTFPNILKAGEKIAIASSSGAAGQVGFLNGWIIELDA